jgi:hypothetical protein
VPVKSFITLAPQPLNSQTGFLKTILIGKTRGYIKTEESLEDIQYNVAVS